MTTATVAHPQPIVLDLQGHVVNVVTAALAAALIVAGMMFPFAPVTFVVGLVGGAVLSPITAILHRHVPPRRIVLAHTMAGTAACLLLTVGLGVWSAPVLAVGVIGTGAVASRIGIVTARRGIARRRTRARVES